MKYFKYFIQFILVILSFLIFRILGHKISSNLSGKIFQIIGPLFRSKKIIHQNIKRAIPDITSENLDRLTKLMWNNYGKIFAEYIFIKEFRYGNLSNRVKIKRKDILDRIIRTNKQVVFISGHFDNFELMAMSLENVGIKLSAIYRPLNNIFLNQIMEKIRKKYICKNQIKKGIGGLKKLISLKRKNYSTALMIDQRVSEGISSNFFGEKALTTTIPAELVKKFDIEIVPIFIERIEGINFEITVQEPLIFPKEMSVQKITDELNNILEKMILAKPDQWIWSHNRWK
tara:strand:- start:4529 stop:5389 length:861 start_codon:yes stop_codon:yes gene_type:complete